MRTFIIAPHAWIISEIMYHFEIQAGTIVAGLLVRVAFVCTSPIEIGVRKQFWVRAPPSIWVTCYRMLVSNVLGCSSDDMSSAKSARLTNQAQTDDDTADQTGALPC